MPEADELKLVVGSMLTDLQNHMTAMARLIRDSEGMGDVILGLSTHNVDIASAGGMLMNQVPMELRQTMNRLRLVVRILEDYRAGV